MVMSPQRQSTVPQIVIDAVNRGWSIFPVDETKKPPLLGFLNKKGEPARLAWKQYQKERASVEQIIQWQNQFNPSGWAVITGAISKLIILDGDGEPGRNTFEGLGLNPHRRTGSGGFHVDFEHPGWHVPTLNSKSKIELGKRWPGLDIRADGGYAVFCGRNESGQYEWLREPGSLESLNILPDTLRDFLGLLCPPGEKLAENSKLNATPRSQSTRWGSARCSVADIALEKYLGEASLRGRDNACFDLACQLRDNNYSQSEAENYCMEFARRTHTSNQKGQTEPFTEADACAKVASAFSYSAREPWTQQSRGTSSTHTGAEQKGTTQPNETEDQATSIVDKAIEDKDLEALLSPKSIAILAQLTRAEYTLYKDKIKGAFEKRINLSDLNSSVSEARKLLEQTDEKPSLDIIADDFADKHKEDWAFNALSSAWYQWTGTHWQNMQDSESQKKSCVTLDRIVRDLMRARDLGINKSSDLDCVVRLAAIHCKRSFVPTPGVVNFRNGTLEVSTGTLRAHDRDDQLTYCLPYDYEVHGQWPAICKFLQELFPDKYARQNFMVHIGLSLMSDNKMHYSGAIIGPPRVGKSTALDLANITCGISEKEYAGKTLFNPDLEGKRTRYMQNKKRIVCIDELPVAALRNEETVKNMMAHSGVEMRGMMRDEELDNRWRPKIFMAMNEKPEYKDTSGAIKERIVPLMVGSTRPKDQRDLQLLDKMKPELGGFAASCIRLALAALKRGYYPLSGAMKAVINEMEAANNPLKTQRRDTRKIGHRENEQKQ
jgi:phage/plasmid-associated DNA primase